MAVWEGFFFFFCQVNSVSDELNIILLALQIMIAFLIKLGNGSQVLAEFKHEPVLKFSFPPNCHQTWFCQGWL